MKKGRHVSPAFVRQVEGLYRQGLSTYAIAQGLKTSQGRVVRALRPTKTFADVRRAEKVLRQHKIPGESKTVREGARSKHTIDQLIEDIRMENLAGEIESASHG